MKNILNNTDKNALIEFIDSVLVSHTSFEYASTVLHQACNIAPNLREPTGYFIVGESRTGKSRLAEEVSNAYPASRTPDGLISYVIKVIVPSKPTVKGLASEILHALGDPLANKGTEQDMTRRILILLKACQVRMLILDEFQHFVDKSARFNVVHHVSDWLKNLLSSSKIIAVLVGLPYGQAVLSQNEQLRGRFTNTIRLSRFDWSVDIQRGDFLGLLDGFSEILSEKFSLPELGSDEMGIRFYLASGGLTGYVFNIIRHSAWNAISNNSTTITLDDFDVGYKRAVSIEDQQRVSPFSKNFDKSDGQAFAKALKVGLRNEDYLPGVNGKFKNR